MTDCDDVRLEGSTPADAAELDGCSHNTGETESICRPHTGSLEPCSAGSTSSLRAPAATGAEPEPVRHRRADGRARRRRRAAVYYRVADLRTADPDVAANPGCDLGPCCSRRPHGARRAVEVDQIGGTERRGGHRDPGRCRAPSHHDAPAKSFFTPRAAAIRLVLCGTGRSNRYRLDGRGSDDVNEGHGSHATNGPGARRYNIIRSLPSHLVRRGRAATRSCGPARADINEDGGFAGVNTAQRRAPTDVVGGQGIAFNPARHLS